MAFSVWTKIKMGTKKISQRLASLFIIGLMLLRYPPQHTIQAQNCPIQQVQPGESQMQENLDFLEEAGIPPEAVQEIALNPEGANLNNYGVDIPKFREFMSKVENRVQFYAIADPQVDDDLILAALEIMGRYGLGQADIAPLVAVQGDGVELFQALSERGLTSAQIDSFLSEISPLVEEAHTRGDGEYLIALGAVGELDPYDVSLYEIAEIVDDPEALQEYFEESGANEEDAQTITDSLTDLNEAGLTSDLIYNIQSDEALLVMEMGGLPEDVLDDLSALDGDPDQMSQCLTEWGYSPEEMALLLAGFGDSLVEGFRPADELLSEENLDEMMAMEAELLLNSAGLDPALLSEIVPLLGDPEALAAYLAEQGLSEDDIALFITRLDETVMGSVLTEEDDLDPLFATMEAEDPYDMYTAEDEFLLFVETLDDLDEEQIESVLEAESEEAAYDLLQETVGDGYIFADSTPEPDVDGNDPDVSETPAPTGDDSDDDGVTDAEDFCPFNGTRGEVDEQGCPLGSQQAADSDSDGLADTDDACPFAGDEGYGLNNIGCPNPPPTADSDGDGFSDPNDTCPNAGDQGFGVDGGGCPNPPPSNDSDGDGIPDPNDPCPNQGDEGFGTDGNGCPNPPPGDSDGDGFADPNDACPYDGDHGNGVDGSGCPNP